MCEGVIDKILVDPELTQQIIVYDLDAVELIKRGERNAIQRPYYQIFRYYIKGVCGKDRVEDEEWGDCQPQDLSCLLAKRDGRGGGGGLDRLDALYL